MFQMVKKAQKKDKNLSELDRKKPIIDMIDAISY